MIDCLSYNSLVRTIANLVSTKLYKMTKHHSLLLKNTIVCVCNFPLYIHNFGNQACFYNLSMQNTSSVNISVPESL